MSSIDVTHLMTLPEDMLGHVMKYCDIPTLGSLGATSKALKILSRKDDVWESHLMLLIESCFDNAFDESYYNVNYNVSEEDAPQKLSLRPLKSTNLAKWFHSWVTTIPHDFDYLYHFTLGNPLVFSELNAFCVSSLSDVKVESNPKCRWLLEDVSLFEYYKHAVAVYRRGKNALVEMEEQWCEDTNRCFTCHEKLSRCECFGRTCSHCDAELTDNEFDLCYDCMEDLCGDYIQESMEDSMEDCMDGRCDNCLEELSDCECSETSDCECSESSDCECSDA